MNVRTTTLEPTAIEREGSPDDLLARVPVKSLTALLGGLAALGLADSADAMVSDGGSSSKSSKSSDGGSSKSSSSSSSAKQTPASQASPPANSSSDRESGSSSAVSRGASQSSSGSGSSGASSGGTGGPYGNGSMSSSGSKSSGSKSSGSSGSKSSGSSGSSSSGSSGSKSSGSSGSSGSSSGGTGGPYGNGSMSSSGSKSSGSSGSSSSGSSGSKSSGSKSSGSSSSGSSSSASKSSGSSSSGSPRTLDPPAASREGLSTSGSPSGSSGTSSPATPVRTDASDGYRGMGVRSGSKPSDSDDRPSGGPYGNGRMPSSSDDRETASSRAVSEGARPSSSSDRQTRPAPAWTGPAWPTEGDSKSELPSRPHSAGPTRGSDDTGPTSSRPSKAPKLRRGPGGEGLPTPPAHGARPTQGRSDSEPARGLSRYADADDFDYSYGENDLQNEWLGTPGAVYGGGPYGNGRMHSTPPRRRGSTRVDPDSIPGPPRPGAPFDFGYPEKGPSLDEFPKGPIGLPYEGQEAEGVTCSRSGSAPRGCTDLVPKGKPKSSAKLGVEGSLVETKGQTDVLQGDGSTRSTLSLSNNLRVTGKAQAESRRRFGFGVNVWLGRTSDYSVSVDDPDRADAIATGEEKAPNPHDPTSLKVDEGLTISKETYLGAGAEGAYNQLRLAVNREAGDRVSSGVTRVNKRRVRIDVGDEETVRQSIEAGVEDPTGLFGLSIGAGGEQASGRKRSVTLDVKTRRGWDAYQRFIVTGKLPSPESKAVKRMSNTDDENWKSTIGSKGKVGPFNWDSSDVTRQGNESVTRYRNGKVERSWVDKTYGVGGAVTEATKPNGKPGKSTYAVRLEDVPDDAANDFLEARGREADHDGDQDMLIRYSKADLWRLRGEARNLILAESDEGTTTMDVDRDLADGEREDVGQHLGVNTAQEVLAMTKRPEEAIRAISATGLATEGTSRMGDAEQFLRWLEFHEERVGERSTRPGRATQVTDSSD